MSVRYAYATGVVALALAALMLLPEARPSTELAYPALGLGLLIGAVLSVRLRPGEAGVSVLLLTALVADARFGLGTLPALAFASFVGALIRRVSGPALLAVAAHETLVFAVAHLTSRALSTEPVGLFVIFAVAFALGQFALWHIAARLGVADRHVARPDPIISLALVPLAVLPLLAWARFGDGGLVLGLAALLAILGVVAEARTLATTRAEAEAERDRLSRANALQQELVNLITHELKTPLTTVIVYTQLVERALDQGLSERVPGHLMRILDAAKGLQRLIDTLLEMSRLESEDLPAGELVDLAVLAHEVALDLEPLAEQKHVRLDVALDAPVPSVLAPMFLLKEALSNLVSNAIKYTPEGGAVRIWAADQAAADDALVIAVTDTGIGLSEADLARLFTRFFRSADPRARAERGSGLGLALTQAIISRIGGRIEVASELDRGTTFRMVLPRAGSPSGSSGSSGSSSS
ncbi:MAG TPA: HAMP domain-containing sensor histidine kinase [Chloroflexota bacterium]